MSIVFSNRAVHLTSTRHPASDQYGLGIGYLAFHVITRHPTYMGTSIPRAQEFNPYIWDRSCAVIEDFGIKTTHFFAILADIAPYQMRQTTQKPFIITL